MGTDLANDSTQPLTWISSLSNSIYRSTEKLPAAWGSRSQSCWPFCWHLVRSYCFSDRLLVRQPVTLWLSLECLYAPFLHLFQIALLRFCCYSCGYMKSGKCVCVCVVWFGGVYLCVCMDTGVVRIEEYEEIVYIYGVRVWRKYITTCFYVSVFVHVHLWQYKEQPLLKLIFSLNSLVNVIPFFFLPLPPLFLVPLYHFPFLISISFTLSGGTTT